MNEEQYEIYLQVISRKVMMLKLLKDIKQDMVVCMLNNSDPKEYLYQLKEQIDNILNYFEEVTYESKEL